MTSIASIHIEAPVKKVFDLVKNPTNINDLPHAMVVEDVHPTREGVGTYCSWRSRYDWLPVEGFHVCTEFVPNRRITFKSSPSFDGQVTYSFEPEGTGTKFTMSIEPRSFWSMPLVGHLWAAFMKIGHEDVLSDVKAALETKHATAA